MSSSTAVDGESETALWQDSHPAPTSPVSCLRSLPVCPTAGCALPPALTCIRAVRKSQRPLSFLMTRPIADLADLAIAGRGRLNNLYGPVCSVGRRHVHGLGRIAVHACMCACCAGATLLLHSSTPTLRAEAFIMIRGASRIEGSLLHIDPMGRYRGERCKLRSSERVITRT